MKLNKLIILVSLFIGGVFLTNCSSSLVYSPSLNLPQQPLAEKEVDLNAGVEMLPETRPDFTSSKDKSTFGLNGHIGYGFTNKFNMYAKGWITKNDNNSYRSGFSMNGTFNFKIDDNSRYMLLPRIGILLDNQNISGYGASCLLIYQSKIIENLSFNSGGGVIWGYKNLFETTNSIGERKISMGFAIQGNAGVIYQISENIRCNLEINPLYQINTFDNKQNFVISPNISLGYTFR